MKKQLALEGTPIKVNGKKGKSPRHSNSAGGLGLDSRSVIKSLNFEDITKQQTKEYLESNGLIATLDNITIGDDNIDVYLSVSDSGKYSIFQIRNIINRLEKIDDDKTFSDIDVQDLYNGTWRVVFSF